MSHQGYQGWFPECFVCGMGNLDGIVCLSPVQEEQHGLTPIRGEMTGISEFFEQDGHWWKRCLLCPTLTLSDPMSWGSLAYCIGCWNHFTKRGKYPPVSVPQVRRMSESDWNAVAE